MNDQVLDINLDGNLVLFSLVDREQDTPTLFVYDNNTQTSVSFPLPEVVITAAFSDDGKTIAYAARSEGVDIVKVLDTTNGSTRSLNTESEKGLFPDVSSNGRFVTYTGFNDDQQKIQIYLADLVTGSTILVSQSPDGQPGNARSWPPSFTANGSHLYFGSQASNLVSNDNNSQLDLFLYELN